MPFGRRAVAERGTGSAGEHGCGSPLERGLGRAADGVDAGVDAVKAALADPVTDAAVGET